MAAQNARSKPAQSNNSWKQLRDAFAETINRDIVLLESIDKNKKVTREDRDLLMLAMFTHVQCQNRALVEIAGSLDSIAAIMRERQKGALR